MGDMEIQGANVAPRKPRAYVVAGIHSCMAGSSTCDINTPRHDDHNHRNRTKCDLGVPYLHDNGLRRDGSCSLCYRTDAFIAKHSGQDDAMAT